MRYHFFMTIIDEADGRPMMNADASIYLAGGTTTAKAWNAESGGTYNNNAPQRQTDTSGFFEFWIDEADYDTAQKFKIVINKSTFTKTLDNIDIIGYLEIIQDGFKGDYPKAMQINYVYDINGNLTNVNGSNGLTFASTLNYDVNGNLTSVENVINNKTITETMSYDVNGNLSQVIRTII